MVWRNVTARGSPKGGEKYNNSFDMNGGILVGGFFRIAFVLSERKKYLRPREKIPRFLYFGSENKSARVSYCYYV